MNPYFTAALEISILMWILIIGAIGFCVLVLISRAVLRYTLEYGFDEVNDMADLFANVVIRGAVCLIFCGVCIAYLFVYLLILIGFNQ